MRFTEEEYNRLTEGRCRQSRYRAFASNEKGREFEKEILDGCEWYRVNGIAAINKVAESYRVLVKYENGKFLGQHTAKAEPDFKGVLKGGRAVAFEAKYTSKSRIQKNAVTEEQGEWLELQHDMGAIAFVCVGMQDKFYCVPWTVWRDMKKVFGKKYLIHEDIKRFEVPYRNGVMFLNRHDKGVDI